MFKKLKEKKFNLAISFLFALLVAVFYVQNVSADDADVTIKEKQVAEINNNLKNVIEENQRLAKRNKELETSLVQLKASGADQSEFASLESERTQIAGQLKDVQTLNRQYSQEIERLEKELKSVELAKVDYSKKTERLEQKLYNREVMGVEGENIQLAQSTDQVVEREDQTMDLLSRIDAFTETDDRLRADTAKAHYNMGNIYFQKGEFEIAAREFYQAATLMPEDADVHYNLAFVSSEKLKDFKTALKHYRQYLYLSPKAADAPFVKEKIVGLELLLQSRIDDSPIETDE